MKAKSRYSIDRYILSSLNNITHRAVQQYVESKGSANVSDQIAKGIIDNYDTFRGLLSEVTYMNILNVSASLPKSESAIINYDQIADYRWRDHSEEQSSEKASTVHIYSNTNPINELEKSHLISFWKGVKHSYEGLTIPHVKNYVTWSEYVLKGLRKPLYFGFSWDSLRKKNKYYHYLDDEDIFKPISLFEDVDKDGGTQEKWLNDRKVEFQDKEQLHNTLKRIQKYLDYEMMSVNRDATLPFVNGFIQKLMHYFDSFNCKYFMSIPVHYGDGANRACTIINLASKKPLKDVRAWLYISLKIFKDLRTLEETSFTEAWNDAETLVSSMFDEVRYYVEPKLANGVKLKQSSFVKHFFEKHPAFKSGYEEFVDSSLFTNMRITKIQETQTLFLLLFAEYYYTQIGDLIGKTTQSAKTTVSRDMTIPYKKRKSNISLEDVGPRELVRQIMLDELARDQEKM